MGDGDAQVAGGQGGSDSGVDVADDDEQARPVLDEQRMQRQHDLGDLLGGGAGADLQVDVRGGNAQLLKEHAIHEKVIMLACMDQARRERSPRPQRPTIGAIFTKLGRAPTMRSTRKFDGGVMET